MTNYPNPGERPEGIGGGADDPGLTAPTQGPTPDEGVLPSSTEEMGGSFEPAPDGATTTTSYEPSGSGATGSASAGWVSEPAPTDSGSRSDVAKSEASDVKDTALGAGSNVAGTAKHEAANVAQEVSGQARGLLDQLRSDVREQGIGQKDRIASTLHSLSKELGSMASKSEEDGPVTDFAHQASRKGGEIAHWLEDHEPGDVLEEVKRYARRRPFAFLAICATAGIVVGRLTRGAVAANTSLDSADSSAADRALPAGPDSRTETYASPPAATRSGGNLPAETGTLDGPVMSGPGDGYDTGTSLAPSDEPGRGQDEYRR